MSGATSSVEKKVSRDELLDKLHTKRMTMENSRTGRTYRFAKRQVSKAQRSKIRKDVNKNGLSALAKKLGVENDPEIMRQMAEMIRSGTVDDADELVKRVIEIQAQRRSEEFNTEIENKGLDQVVREHANDIDAKQTLNVPSANVARASLQGYAEVLKARAEGTEGSKKGTNK